LTNEEIAQLQAWFGVRGKFPAMHAAAGRAGDLIAKSEPRR
jgi:hypothetical protein